ncbi:MFS transporter [Streptomyces sp. NBC_01723]|uniref:MFS transporter n=1 Tax=Streptomyces sp. NBC_01723 TaxID=2975921 RepID=UPI003FCE37BB
MSTVCRRRGLVVSLNSTGYAVGATIGGISSVALIDRYGWRPVFLAGGLATLAVIPLVFRLLPESLDFLLSRRPANALSRVDELARRMGSQTCPRSRTGHRRSTPPRAGSAASWHRTCAAAPWCCGVPSSSSWPPLLRHNAHGDGSNDQEERWGRDTGALAQPVGPQRRRPPQRHEQNGQAEGANRAARLRRTERRVDGFETGVRRHRSAGGTAPSPSGPD